MFIGASGQNQHTPLLFKILYLTENKKIVNNPFKNIWNLMQVALNFVSEEGKILLFFV